MPLLERVQDLAVKIETTPGTAESLAASEGTIQVYDIEGGPEIDMTDRPRAGNLGNLAGVTGMRVGRIRFRSEFIGGATDPAWATALLPPCGYATSAANGSYKPRSEAPGTLVKCATFGWYQNGRFASIFGASGNFDIQFESGKPIFILWDFTGLWGGLTSAAIIAPTKETALPIRFASAALGIGSTTAVIGRMNIRSNNTIEIRPHGAGANATGGLTALISSRRPKVVIDPEAVLPAAQDHWGNYLSHTTAALSGLFGTSGNRVTITAPALQVASPQFQRRQGMFADQLEFDCISTTADNELVIGFD